MTIKAKRFLIISVVIFLVVILLFKIYEGIVKTKNSFLEDLPSTFSLTPEDSSLFSNEFRNKIKVIEVRRSKVRNPISIILLDTQYYLFIRKIESNKTISLNDILHVQEGSAGISTGSTYDVIDNGIYFRFLNKTGKTEDVSGIYLTLSGDSIQSVTKKDSVISYHLLCNELSVSYSKVAPIDIFLEGKQKYTHNIIIPLDILLLKRNGGIYFIFMMPTDPNKPISSNLLNRVISDE